MKPIAIPVSNPSNEPFEFSMRIEGFSFQGKFTETDRSVELCVHDVPLALACEKCIKATKASRPKRRVRKR